MAQRRKYFLFTTSTNCSDGKLFNNEVFVDGYEMPPFSRIEEMVKEQMQAQGLEPKPHTTIILYMAKLTKQEYEALRK